jgi:hypothetical protein
MNTAIRPYSGSHPTERNIGLGLSIFWVAEATFFPAEVAGYAVGINQIANLVWIAIVGGCVYFILRWERIAALVMVPLVLLGAIAIVVSAMMQSSVNMSVVMMGVLPAFVIPGILGATLLLHSERR